MAFQLPPNVPEGMDLLISENEDEHDTTVTLTFRGVSVGITLRERQYAARQRVDANTVVVLVDQVAHHPTPPVAVYLNDDVLVDTSR